MATIYFRQLAEELKQEKLVESLINYDQSSDSISGFKITKTKSSNVELKKYLAYKPKDDYLSRFKTIITDLSPEIKSHVQAFE